MKRAYVLPATLVIMLLVSISVMAQDCQTCNEALTKDVLEQSNNVYTSAKYLEVITESEYNELKRNGSAGLDIPVLKGLISASASYEDFKKNVRDFTKRIELETHVGINSNFKDVRTSPMAYNAWARCMESCNSVPGVYLFKTADSEQNGTFKIKYKPAPGETDNIYCALTYASEGVIRKETVLVTKNGSRSMTYRRTFKNDKSTTLVSVNASRTPSGSVSYSDNFSSIFIRPKGVKVLALGYSYKVITSKLEIGATVKSCMWNNFTTMLQCIQTSGRELKKSCDDKWGGDVVTISVAPTEGYSFGPTLEYDNLKLGGPMAGWNWGQRCLGKNDFFTVNTAQRKEMKVWLHKEVDAHLEVTSYREDTINETAFADVDEVGRISFVIPTSRLNNYNISISLSTGTTINITPQTVNTYAYLNIEQDKTRFTLKDRTISTNALSMR